MQEIQLHVVLAGHAKHEARRACTKRHQPFGGDSCPCAGLVRDRLLKLVLRPRIDDLEEDPCFVSLMSHSHCLLRRRITQTQGTHQPREKRKNNSHKGTRIVPGILQIITKPNQLPLGVCAAGRNLCIRALFLTVTLCILRLCTTNGCILRLPLSKRLR